MKWLNKIKNRLDYLENQRDIFVGNIIDLEAKNKKLESSIEYRDGEMKRMSQYLQAVVNYLDVDFKDEYIDDLQYLPEIPRKIMILRAYKSEKKPKK